MAEVELIDNVRRTLGDDLASTLRSGSRVAIAASCFSIYAFQELKAQLADVEELRFIFTSPSFLAEKAEKQSREFYIPRLHRERSIFGSEFEIRLRNELSLKAVARECASWIRAKGHFKSNRTSALMPSMVCVDQTVYSPVNAFTTVELGRERGDYLATMITRMDAPLSRQYLNIFDSIWRDDAQLQTVTDQVIDAISNAYSENAPEFLYFVTLYNIFSEFLEDISEDVLPNDATGFKSSAIWGKLYDFQRDAALAIINKLEKYNGCILADSVGLGKTFTALAVVKYYENRNKSVLVLCPKKLYDNWVTYRSNYVNNPLVADRLRYDILYHTDLSRQSGTSCGLDLEHINWGNYDLVVIDESHNFRNGGKVTTSPDEDSPRENRYLQLMNRVIRAGVKTKVLMLSATPVNNRFYDLRNQLALAYEGDSSRLDALLSTTSSLDDIFRGAQTAFNRWSKLPPAERTTKALLDTLSFDFFEVLDSVTIARSRRHIEQYYDTAAIGRFPERRKPISRRPPLTDISTTVNFNDIFVAVSELNLAIYTPSDFILPSRMDKYAAAGARGSLGNLSRSGRERGIRKLTSINLLKRLESSVNSFRLTLCRIKDYIERTIAAIDIVAARQGAAQVDDFDFSDDLDFDEREDTIFFGGKSTRIDLADMDYVQWRQYLATDLENLRMLLFMLADITPEHDSKLQMLMNDIFSKVEQPINPGNRKVIVFTAFADTAEYLYSVIAPIALERAGLHTALVSGDATPRATLRLKEKLDFNRILTLFSPLSKERDSIYPGISDEIDILIATDCISEGQNLQDCDFLINYDIHWNPVRIIQRFGRIDRIGSRNASIQLVNYWPDMDLDDYINLKGRVEARMKVSVLTATGDDNPLSDEEQGDLQYRRDQLLRLREEVVDIEEMNTGVSIMDLGLNEFRLDLLEYSARGIDLEHTPMGLHAMAPSSAAAPPGVIFVLKNRDDGVNIDRRNRLHPFYMVYIRPDGSVLVDHLDPKGLLDRMRSLCRGRTEPIMDLCRRFNAETADGRRMGTYSRLLADAIASIISVKQQSDLTAFFSGDSGSLFGPQLRGLDDFELICFLIVR